MNVDGKFQLMNYCPRYECTLSPGDILYNPSGYWHGIENMTNKSIGIATRYACKENYFSKIQLNTFRNKKHISLLKSIGFDTLAVDEHTVINGKREKITKLETLLNYNSLRKNVHTYYNI